MATTLPFACGLHRDASDYTGGYAAVSMTCEHNACAANVVNGRYVLAVCVCQHASVARCG